MTEKAVDAPLSEKAAKKAALKAEKEAKKQARLAEQEAQAAEAAEKLAKEANDVFEDDYGYLTRAAFKKTDRKWTAVSNMASSSTKVWIRARLDSNRCKGALGFIVLRQKRDTCQAVLDSTAPPEMNFCSKDMIKWVGSLPVESVVDVYGEVTQPAVAVLGVSHGNVEIKVSKLFCVGKAIPELPFQLKDANVSEYGVAEEGVVRVGQETRLDNRILDLRSSAMQAILRISHTVCQLFREHLTEQGFTELHTPKLLGGSSEGGANVFKLEYFGQPACLAQSPQLFKQMAICADLEKVFEIGPVFRAENSNTHRHLCEFTGLDLEVAFKEHYSEVLEILEKLFVSIFKGLQSKCSDEIKAVHAVYKAEPFEFSEEVLHLDYLEGMDMLRTAGLPIPEDAREYDMGTEEEKTLGKLVKEKYNTDFFYMINYPQSVRPFYTMPNPEKEKLSNSYDFFMRGEEILSGAQRIHDPVFLAQRAQECGIEVSTIKSYIDAFMLGAYPHAGAGIGLERVVMLFLGLPNIRKSSMFPRDPKRLSP